MIQSFYQTKTVTDDAVTAQIPNSSRTCTHVRITFQNIGVTPSSVTCQRREVDTVLDCPLSKKKPVTDTVDTDVFRKLFAYVRTHVRVKSFRILL